MTSQDPYRLNTYPPISCYQC